MAFPKNVEVDNSLSDQVKNKILLFHFFLASLLEKKIYLECKQFLFNPYLYAKAFWRTLKFEVLSEITLNWLKDQKKAKVEFNDESLVLFYSFWINAIVYGLIKFNVETRYQIISRANGYDVFNFRHNPKFFPFRDYYINKIDLILCASEFGKKYLIKKYPEIDSKVQVSYLGILNILTRDKSINDFSGKTKLVSCSSISDVKRVEKIALTLAKITEFQYDWFHIGSGPRFKILKIIKFFLKKENQEWHFLGHIPNNDIPNLYSKISPHLFINLSTSEGGVPVSIMEAARAGIPVLATNIGGSGEIIKQQETGILVDVHESNQSIALKIKSVLKNQNLLLTYSLNLRKEYELNFQSTQNYKKFIETLKHRNII